MRRITGLYENVEHVIIDYGNGMVECPTDLCALLCNAEGAMPQGEELVQKVRPLFGGVMDVQEY